MAKHKQHVVQLAKKDVTMGLPVIVFEVRSCFPCAVWMQEAPQPKKLPFGQCVFAGPGTSSNMPICFWRAATFRSQVRRHKRVMHLDIS